MKNQKRQLYFIFCIKYLNLGGIIMADEQFKSKLDAVEQKPIQAINPIVLLMIILVIAAIATYIVPAGSFDRVLDKATDREIVNPATFKYIAQKPIGIFDFFMSVTLGMQHAAQIIFFLFIVGGAFAVIDKTGALAACLANTVQKTKGKEILFIPFCMIIFGCGSCFAGNFEEWLVFIPLMISVSVAMGFDSMTGISVVFCAACAGYGGAMTNPFTVGVAQGIAGLPMFSGILFRGVVFVVLLSVAIVYVMHYAHKIHKNPELSIVRDIDLKYNSELKIDTEKLPKITTRHKLVLATFGLAIVFLVYAVIKLGFYIDELAALFLIVGLIAGIVGGLKPGAIADAFLDGCNNMLFACVVIGLCNASLVILQNASIMDTIIHSLAGLLKGLPATVSACGMFIVQDIFNLVVPSGSGQAAITMPIMAPLADLIGLTRQTAVLAFQMGDAFTNLITPTSGEIIAAIAMAKIPYSRWLKWFVPLFFMWWVVAFGALIIAVLTNYGPF